MKWTIDPDKMAQILKEDKPLSYGSFDDEQGKPKILVIFLDPSLEKEAEEFSNRILEANKK